MLITGACLLGLLFSHLLAAARKTEFVSSARLELPSVLLAYPGPTLPGTVTDAAFLDLPMMNGRRVLTHVVEELDLSHSRSFLGDQPPAATTPEDRYRLLQTAVERLRTNLHIVMVGQTSIARIEYSSADPALSLRIVTAALNAFLADRYHSRYEAVRARAAFGAPALETLKARANATQRELLLLQQQMGTPGSNPKKDVLAAGVEDLTHAATEATLVRIEADARLQQMLSTGIAGNPAAATDTTGTPDPANASSANASLTSSAAAEHEALSLARAQAAELTATLGPNHPRSIAALARVQHAEAELERGMLRAIGEARAAARLARAHEELLRAQLTAERRLLSGTRAAVFQSASLERQYQEARNEYFAFLEDQHYAESDVAFDQDDIRIIDHPSTFTRQPSPSEAALMLYGVSAAFSLAVLILWSVDTTPSSWKSIERLEGLIGAHALAYLPRLPPAGASADTSEQAPLSLFGQGVLDVFAAIRRSEARVILVTSTSRGEGKTIFSVGLATTIARSGSRVLLIDADLAHPSLAKILGASGRTGFSNVVEQRMTLAKAVRPVPDCAGLDLLASGPLPPHPSLLLESAGLTALVAEARSAYDFVVIDGRGALASDPVLLARHSDAVVWMLRFGQTRAQLIARSMQHLAEHTKAALGLVVNGVNLGAVSLSQTRPERLKLLTRSRP